MSPLPPDFVADLRKSFAGDIRNDAASRVLYSTDASIYQMEPLGVVIPRTQEDLHAAVELAARYQMPLLARGSGSSLAGQAIGEALIIDCSRWLDKLVEIDPDAHTAVVEPGVILSRLNAAAARYGLQFGPDPASAERATIGGVVANNATGAHSILYGMTADHLKSADVIMADGSLAVLGMQRGLEAAPAGGGNVLFESLLRTVLRIRQDHAEAIKAHFPVSWRNSAGYRLNYLLPWSATRPPQWAEREYPPASHGSINLSALLAGSEGTLAVMRRVTLNLVPRPPLTVLAILSYPGVAEACEDVPRLLENSPSAVELIPRMILQLARGVPGYALQMGWLNGDPAALLAVEFSGDSLPELLERAKRLGSGALIASTQEQQDQIWNIRRVGLGLLDSRPQSARPCAFVEDCAIPVDRLGEFVHEIEGILGEHNTQGGIYAHASAGCLHIRPILDLKSASGVRALHEIGAQVFELTLRLGGAMASEHGDGLARGEWIGRTYGDELTGAMRQLKNAVDPHGILNPGKMFDAPPMDRHLRYGTTYRARPWVPSLDFQRSGGLDLAIEQCNGQGVCRKLNGVMCPSFQATREEMHSTRGRANLLRHLITAGIPTERVRGWDPRFESAVFDALDLCLACKGCTAECPSGVDMPRLKSEFLSEYYRHHRRLVRDYLFGYFHVTARVLSSLSAPVNFAAGLPFIKNSVARALHITQQRPFPKFGSRHHVPHIEAGRAKVLFVRDAFTHFVEPDVEKAAFDLLDLAGYDVLPLSTPAAGAALLAKGFVRSARQQAERLLQELRCVDPEGRLPLVGVEPSEVYALRHEYPALVSPSDREMSERVARSWMLEEFLIREGELAKLRVAISPGELYFHPHCHQIGEPPRGDSLPSASEASLALLRACGWVVSTSDAGCCGMAGTFGYEDDHYDLSQQIGSLRLFPALRARAGVGVAATGAACRMQISQATGVRAEHPAVWAQRALIGA